jgi:tRNA (guanosine-2'-O-)-methyltransferase
MSRKRTVPLRYKPEPGWAKPYLSHWKERHRRMAEEEREAWQKAEKVGEPGLRSAYPAIPRAPIRLIACPMSKAVNHGGLLRLAEAFRLERVDLAPEADGCIDGSGARGSRELQPHRWVPAERAVTEARAEGLRVYGVTLAEGSRPLETIEWRFPCALVMGSEADGLPGEIVRACDETIAIPLYGLVTSLNVASAAALVVHAAMGAYVGQHPEFEPVRKESRALIGLNPGEY